MIYSPINNQGSERMTLAELIAFHVQGAEACEAYALTPAGQDVSRSDTKALAKHYNKRAAWHRAAVQLLESFK